MSEWIRAAIDIRELNRDLSERDLSILLGISKTEINRLVRVGRLDRHLLLHAAYNGVEKWALVELALEHNLKLRNIISESIKLGIAKTRKDVLKIKNYFWNGL